MISVRLPKNLEEKLNELSSIEKKTRTQIIKESLLLYIENHQTPKSPYELGEKYFGKYKSGFTDRSVNHRDTIRQKMRNNHKRNA